MTFNFQTPITAYETLAIILAALALIVPFLKWIYKKFLKRLKLYFTPSETITLYFNKSGSYVLLGGVFEAKNKAIVIKNISVDIIRDSDNATLQLDWSTFLSLVYRRIGGNYENTCETAHPFKVEANTLFPVNIEFGSLIENIEEKNDKRLGPIYQYTREVINSTQNPTIPYIDSAVKNNKTATGVRDSLSDLFFWKEGKYRIVLKTQYNNKLLKHTYKFSLTSDESKKLRENIDNLIVAQVADCFQLKLIMNTVRKRLTVTDKGSK